MSLTRRRFNQCLLTGLATLALPVARADELVAGRDWIAVTPPQPGESAERVEVLEFFSYGCPHCRDLHPLITRWATRLPEEVAFRRVPVSFGRTAWANLARSYFALELGGDLERMDQAVFDAIHQQRANLYTKPHILDWLNQPGLDVDAFGELFDSFAVQTRLGRSDSTVRDYQVDHAPLLTVDGRYKVVGTATKSLADLLSIADKLIERTRA